jgi:hypothetical protein
MYRAHVVGLVFNKARRKMSLLIMGNTIGRWMMHSVKGKHVVNRHPYIKTPKTFRPFTNQMQPSC